jgi:hypothetical protein
MAGEAVGSDASRNRGGEGLEVDEGDLFAISQKCRDSSVKLLSVKTHRRAATGNTRSREASGTAGGPQSLGQRPKSPAHALAWSSARRAT